MVQKKIIFLEKLLIHIIAVIFNFNIIFLNKVRIFKTFYELHDNLYIRKNIKILLDFD